VFIIQLDNERT